MRWYVNSNGKTEGPLDEGEVAAGLKSGKIPPASSFRDEAASAWVPLAQTPFAQLALKPQSNSRTFVVATVATVGVMIAWASCSDPSSRKSSSGAPAPSPVQTTIPAVAAAAPPRQPTFQERLVAAATLADALELVRPGMTDTVDEPPPAAAALSIWGARNMKWTELQALTETKRALVMKDPEAERGKRLCTTGTINQIQVDRSAGVPIYFGGLMTPSFDSVRFAAVGSTGELVEGSRGRLCGVVTGTYSYSNVRGGQTHAVYVVGMFDLPANKKAAPAAAL